MEKNKGIIIVISVIAVMSLLVLVGLFFFYPKDNAQKPAAVAAGTNTLPGEASKPAGEFDPVEWTRNTKDFPGLTTPPVTTETKPSDDPFVITLDGEKKPETITAPAVGTGASSAADPAATVAGHPQASFPEPTAAPVVNQSPVVKPAVKVPASAVKKAPAKPAPVKTIKVKEFWIQVAAYKDRYSAETAAKKLETNGLKGSLITANSAGSTVIRVRVGPYTNKAEADKFLAWIQPVEGFGEAFVTEVMATKVVK